jgi:hypothetical protein
MTTTAPTRILVLVGVAVAALAAFVLVVRPMLLDDDEATSSTPTAKAAQSAKPQAASKPAQRAKPQLRLAAGLPAPVAKQLRYSKVVVVTLFTPNAAADVRAIAQARAGAKSAKAGFVAINVSNERRARELTTFAGTSAAPAVLVVKRPGTIISHIEGATDSQIVAQAAQNAGAGAAEKKKQK